MKLLHSADLHLDTPFTGWSREQTQYLRQQLLRVPEQLAQLCRREHCDLVLLSGDLFDGPWSRESLQALQNALEDCAVPVFISPGNHDPFQLRSAYSSEVWPSNVHIFKQPAMESVYLGALDCRIYGAGYRSMDCEGLLAGFRSRSDARYHIGILHGDPVHTGSAYCPITAAQIANSGLDYLALGHMHKQGGVRQGKTLCAWPGCPMGRGFDETGEKGAYIVNLEDTASVNFVALNTPSFFDLEATPQKLEQLLGSSGNRSFYRITLVGNTGGETVQELYRRYHRFPNLQLRDRRSAESELWSSVGTDTPEGVYFGLLKDALAEADEETKKTIFLAAKLSRQILDGQEVQLP